MCYFALYFLVHLLLFPALYFDFRNLIVMSQQSQNLIELDICKCKEYCKIKTLRTSTNFDRKIWTCACSKVKNLSYSWIIERAISVSVNVGKCHFKKLI